LREEVGVDLSGCPLRLAWSGTLPFESREDAVDIWEAPVENAPAVHLISHEVIWAAWVDPAEALGRPLLPHVATYLAEKGEMGVNVRRG
jgi:hypothetical protein